MCGEVLFFVIRTEDDVKGMRDQRSEIGDPRALRRLVTWSSETSPMPSYSAPGVPYPLWGRG